MIFDKDITQIAHNYQYFILDIWGVIHDGQHLYPNVLEQLKYLRVLGKNICFLSNAPRRANKAAEVLDNLGIHKDLYDFIITSGEATYSFLQKNQKNFPKLQKLIGNNTVEEKYYYYYIGPPKDADLLNGLNYFRTNQANKADFVVATGFDNDHSTIEEKLPQLKEAKKNNLTMICVNPDLIVVRQNGSKAICAGILAEEYKKMNGVVAYFGKPHLPVYQQVLKKIPIKDKKQILIIGDSLETDIMGANNNDIDSALIAGGILANDLKIKHGELPDQKLMNEICNKYLAFPKFIIGNL